MNTFYSIRNYFISSLKSNFHHKFENGAMIFFNKKDKRVTFESIIDFLKTEHDLELKEANDIIIEWSLGADTLLLVESGVIE